MIVSGTISNGTMSLTGLGTLEFDGTIATGATLLLTDAVQMAPTSNMTMSGGTFNMGGFATTLNSLFFTGGTLTQTVPLTLGVASPAAALTIQQGATLGTLGRQIVLSNSGGVLFSGTTGVATINNDINLGSGTVTFDTEASGSSTLVLNGALSSGNGITVQGLDVLLSQAQLPIPMQESPRSTDQRCYWVKPGVLLQFQAMLSSMQEL